MATTLAALQQLVDAAPSTYISKTNGARIVRFLYNSCRSARLTDVEAPTDVSALEAVFDVALRHGLGSLILDYVHEVCMSRTLVSSDPVDAALLDGDTVQRWCKTALDNCKDSVLEQLDNPGLEQLHGSAVLHQQTGCINALLMVVEALVAGNPSRYLSSFQKLKQQQQ